jgi:putative FmdB family regulatory protein
LPTYEYRCASGHQYEKREGFDAPSKQKCRVCGKGATRVLHAPPVVFKGSGFYKTDSRGSAGSSESTPSTPASTASSDHGHTHGPGGHTHDSTPAPAPAADTESTAAS